MQATKRENAALDMCSSQSDQCLSCPLEEFVCVEVLWPSQPNGVMLSTVKLPNYTLTGQA